MYNYFLSFAIAILFMFNTSSWATTTFSNDIKVESAGKTEVSKEYHYTIKVRFPTFKNTPYAAELNGLITSRVEGAIQEFKKNLGADKPIQGLPFNENSNALDINNKITHATRNLVSIRFSIYTFFYGSAHPMTNYQSLNFDLTNGKELTLKDLFKNSDYLTFISNYSKKVLVNKLSKEASQPTEPDAEGLKPTLENFKVWNITPDGLLITFPPYQVAAYVFGEQEVLIPRAELKGKLKTDVWH